MDQDAKKVIEALDGNADAFTMTLPDSKKEVKVFKATAKQLFMILEIVKIIMQQFNLGKGDDVGGLQALANKVQDPVFLMELLMENFDRIKKLATALCSLEETEVELLALDDLVMLIYAEWTVNERFFTNRVMPLIQQLRTKGE